MKIEDWALVALYDDKVISLMNYKPLRKATVKIVFNNPKIKTFKRIEGTNNVTQLSEFIEICFCHTTRTPSHGFSFAA